MNETLPSKEIIDATQNAVLNAVSSVADVLENTAQELGTHGAEPFYLHAEFWVAMAFVLVVVGFAKPVGSIVLNLLRKRGESIDSRIKNAIALKEDAQKLLADYERKYRSTEKEVAEILAKSEREIEMLKKEALAKLDEEMAIKEKEAKTRLKMSEKDVSEEIASKTADLTIAVVKKVLEKRLDDKSLDDLIDGSIKNLEKLPESL